MLALAAFREVEMDELEPSVKASRHARQQPARFRAGSRQVLRASQIGTSETSSPQPRSQQLVGGSLVDPDAVFTAE